LIIFAIILNYTSCNRIVSTICFTANRKVLYCCMYSYLCC